jgi:3-hydroxymyristoyl/3-hydroxydecanoyl-(acyl carrier protein) dehydratase
MTKYLLNSDEVKKFIPHRYPFLFIDKIIYLKPYSEIIAVKNLSINEEIFNGHFQEQAIFPGVLSVEACAQSAGVLCSFSNLLSKISEQDSNNTISENFENKIFDYNNQNDLNEFDLYKNKIFNFLKNDHEFKQNIFYLTTIDGTKFRMPMIPGASLYIKTKVEQRRSNIWKFNSEIFIDNNDSFKAIETNFTAFLKK